jgi:hypothetical protein
MTAGTGQLSAEEQNAWKSIEPKLAKFDRGGMAVLIEPSGWYLAHQSALPVATRGFARTSGGLLLELSPIASDNVTQLVLLKATSGFPTTGSITPVKVALDGSISQFKLKNLSAKPLIGVGPQGVFRADLADIQRVGITGPARRGVTLSELRFENPAQAVGGALTFTLDGALVGVVAAAVETNEVSQQKATNRRAENVGQMPVANFGAGGGAAQQAAPLPQADRAQNTGFGPQSMRVAYSVSPTVLRRVVDGFLSKDHVVKHPALGIQCQDLANGGGAEIRIIQKGGTAEAAGLLVGDVILGINQSAIASATDYTRFLTNARVGEVLKVRVKRGTETLTLNVTVGS